MIAPKRRLTNHALHGREEWFKRIFRDQIAEARVLGGLGQRCPFRPALGGEVVFGDLVERLGDLAHRRAQINYGVLQPLQRRLQLAVVDGDADEVAHGSSFLASLARSPV